MRHSALLIIFAALFALIASSTLAAQEQFSMEEEFWKNSQELKISGWNVAITFPGKTRSSTRPNGLASRIWNGLSESCSVTYEKIDKGFLAKLESGEATRKWVFDTEMKNQVKGLDYVILESSPIRWNGHYGHEFAFAHASNGQIRVRRVRNLLIGGEFYHLSFGSRVFLPDADLAWLRSQDRKRAYRFFDSMKLISKVEHTAKPQSETISGRWVVNSIGGKRQSQPTEYAFLGNQFLSGKEGGFGDVSAFSDLGKFEFLAEEGLIQLDLILIGKRYLRYEIDGETLKMQIGKSKIEGFAKDLVMELRRPGAKSK